MIWVFIGRKAIFEQPKTKSKPSHFQFKPVLSRLCLSEKSDVSTGLIPNFEK